MKNWTLPCARQGNITDKKREEQYWAKEIAKASARGDTEAAKLAKIQARKCETTQEKGNG